MIGSEEALATKDKCGKTRGIVIQFVIYQALSIILEPKLIFQVR